MSNHNLTKQKKRLSLLFSVAIFSIIALLEIGFLCFKYFDYRSQEFGRLTLQSQAITRLMSENTNFEQDVLNGKGLSFSGGIWMWRAMMMWNERNSPMQRGERRGIRTENFFLYNIPDGKILFSPIKDDELDSLIYQQIEDEKQEWKGAFHLSDAEHLFLSMPITPKIGAVFFVESQMTVESLVMDFFIYLIGAILLSLVIYMISSRFVDKTLSPVEKSMDDMEQFIHNAGHELKTPLSSIKSSLELMSLKKNYKEGISESIGELDRMNGLIQALISLSTIDKSTYLTNIELSEIVQSVVRNHVKKSEERNIVTEIITNHPTTIIANREYVEILLSNLLSNAIKYNKSGGKITITIDKQSIEIQDTGVGIAKENIPKIFDRFYQEGEARDENSFGIGLSLVKKITDMYGWKIAVESEKWAGTKVIIKF